MEEEKNKNLSNKSGTSLAKKAVKNFCDGSTIHGISPIFNAKNILMRLFWIAIFFSVWSLLIWQVSKLIKKVYSNDTIIKKTNEKRDEIEFPTVIISNADPYSKAKLASFTKLQGNSSGDSIDFKAIVSTTPYVQLEKLGQNLNHFGLKRLNMCTFDGSDCWNDIVAEVFPFVGNYLEFNRYHLVRQRRHGSKYGLSMILNINSSDYSNLFNHGYGVLIHIARSNFVDQSILHSKGLAAPPGALTRIKMKKKEIKRLPHPFPDNCTGSTIGRDENGFHMTQPILYTQETCHFGHLLRQQMMSCGFVDPQYKGMLEYFVDIQKSNISFNMPENSTDAWKCLEEAEFHHSESTCQRLCDDEEYDFTISTLRWPTSKEAIELLAGIKESFPASNNVQNWTVNDIYKNLVKIEIYFSDFEVEVVEQKPAYDWDGFVSDFGGQVGLWIGASVYSAFEIGSLLLSLCYCLLHNLRSVKKYSVNGER